MESWLKKNPDVIYYEVSAMDGSNVNQAFNKIANNFLELQNSMSNDPIESIGTGKKKFDLQSQTKKKKKKCCK